MVFRKYRAVKQWGKMDTRIFKEMYNARNKRRMPSFQVPSAVKDKGVHIYDVKDPFLFQNQIEQNNLATVASENISNDHPFKEPSEQDHPLYKENKAFVFESDEPLSDGISQAAIITNSVVKHGLPETILHNNLIEIEEELVNDSILHGERYDPTLEKLPERFDPVLFWIKHVRVHGTPVVKRNNIILNNLLRQVVFAGLRNDLLKKNFLLNRDEPLSVMCQGGKYFNSNPLVIRGQPHLTVQSNDSIVSMPWAGPIDINDASKTPLPDIYPLSPVIDLNRENIYNEDVLLARNMHQSYMHSILWSREQNQKYPWTREQNMANAIVMTYAAAVAQAKRRGTDILEKPLIVRGVQLVDGRLDLVAFQLNTLKMADEKTDELKNLVWIEKGLRLYKPKPYYEEMKTVEKLDMDVFKKFASLILGFGTPHTH